MLFRSIDPTVGAYDDRIWTRSIVGWPGVNHLEGEDFAPVIAQALAGEELKPGPHKIQGIGAGFIPGNLDLKLVDKVVAITNEEAISTARRLMEEEGILAGISSGAAVAAALKLQEDEAFTNKNIVVILPSSGERYLSTALFADLFTEKELQQ